MRMYEIVKETNSPSQQKAFLSTEEAVAMDSKEEAARYAFALAFSHAEKIFGGVARVHITRIDNGAKFVTPGGSTIQYTAE